jgi:hypothetical protein
MENQAQQDNTDGWILLSDENNNVVRTKDREYAIWLQDTGIMYPFSHEFCKELKPEDDPDYQHYLQHGKEDDDYT